MSTSPGSLTLVLASVLAGSLPTAAAPAAQGPVAIRIANPGERPWYLEWSGDVREVPRCEVRRGAATRRCTLFPPFCVWPCSPQGTPRGCRKCGEPASLVRIVPARGSITLGWDGQEYTTRSGRNTCDCFSAAPAAPGRYRLTVCATREATCTGKPGGCAGGPSGVASGAPTGKPVCTSVDVDLPARREIVITLPR